MLILRVKLQLLQFTFFFFFYTLETWLKKRWQTICKEYCNAQIYNDKHKHKPKHIKLAKQLKFLNVNKLKDLYKVNSMDDDSSNENDAEFCITQEILDKCEDDTAENCAATAADNENVEILNYEEEYIMQENDADHDKIEIICANDKDINELEELTPNKTATNEPEAECTQPPDDRNEDRIFGELVTAMLLRMGPSERRQAKKEIMNILL